MRVIFHINCLHFIRKQRQEEEQILIALSFNKSNFANNLKFKYEPGN